MTVDTNCDYSLAEWIAAEALWLPVGHQHLHKPASLRLQVQNLPDLDLTGPWPAQVRALRNSEVSLAESRLRALIQMASGSGKTFTAVTTIYRLIKQGSARGALFLVDRANLGRQALKEFEQYVTPTTAGSSPTSTTSSGMKT